MTLVAAKQAYQREEVDAQKVGGEVVGDGSLPWLMALPTGDLQGPTAGPWNEDSGAAVAHSPELAFILLGRLYGIQLSSEVISFLEDNPELVPVLFEAWQEVDLRLEAHPRLELRLSSDPEVEGLTMLYAIVHTTSEPEQAFRGLKALDAGWLSLQSPPIQELFNVDVEFD